MTTKLYKVASWAGQKCKAGQQWLARPTGEFRPPRKGEWYLSGAIVEAWQAMVDLSSSYPIARVRLYQKHVTWLLVDGPEETRVVEGEADDDRIA